MLMREQLRDAAELALCASGARQISRWRARRRTLVLAYHNVVPAGALAGGDRSLQLPVADFAAQLDALMTTHDVIPLADALKPAPLHRRRPCAAITFDDAYCGAVTAGVEELARRSLPATIFVSPAYLNGCAFWWDLLSQAGSQLPDDIREFALTALRGEGNEIRAWAERQGIASRPLPAHALCASEDELGRAVGRAGITVASHSWSHANLTQLGAARLREELWRPIEWLRTRFDAFVPLLSYPYGLSSAGVEAAAASAGYVAALRVTGGWMRSRPSNAFAIPRLNVPSGISRRGFALRADGMLCR
jgi:peptidoglycan/xylan/chitin deacetylase (PgdA/CDA1 family)